jgi:large subunit ribosomal protein L28e
MLDGKRLKEQEEEWNVSVLTRAIPSTGHNNALLVKRNQSGGVQFSKDPLNLVNKHSRKVKKIHHHKPPNLQTRQNRHQLITIRLQYSSLANPRAIGVNVVGGKIELVTKQGQNFNKPSKSYTKTTFKATTPSRKLTNNVVSGTTKKGYRTDLHMETIQRVSAVKKSLCQVKANVQPTKLRGSKARKAAAEKQ